jgi:uncharacterized protein YdeI (YjbR/CyaY-like superfamily)
MTWASVAGGMVEMYASRHSGRLSEDYYRFYFSQPKQSTTRESRIEKYIPKIFDGMGLDDQ